MSQALGNIKARQAVTRLTDWMCTVYLSGRNQILGTDSVLNELLPNAQIRFRSLGAMDIQGRNEFRTVLSFRF